MKPKLRFEKPHIALQDSYRSLVSEFVERGEKHVPFTLSFPNDDFPTFLTRLSDLEKGIGIPSGFVAHSTYWLVRDGIEVVAVSNIRHALTDALRSDGGNIGYGVRPSARCQGFASELLKHSLMRARAMGLPEAWLTCSKNNHASALTILRNGGSLVSEEFLPSRGEVVQRYRIPLNDIAL